MFPITENVVNSSRHKTFYLAAGPTNGPPLFLLHGWPELSLSWRHQLPCFASLGFRVIAPDMRGYGRSSVPTRQEDYAIEHAVDDMLELASALGIDKAVWVGHDWGSAVVWSLATHHSERCHGVANLCVPYLPGGIGHEQRAPLIDRSIYPEDKYPAGQWDYALFYLDHFDKVCTEFEADLEGTLKALFRSGNPDGKGKPARSAEIRRQGGWFGPAGKAPSLPRDPAVITEQDLAAYVAALASSGFSGPNSWYMNDARNGEYARRAKNGGRIELPVLFLHADYDYTCETIQSRLAEPMRAHCTDLAEAVVQSGHWMAQEKPHEVNAALAAWLARKLPNVWPSQSSR